MSENLPTIQITPAMAQRFAREYNVKVSKDEARHWLVRHGTEIERGLMRRPVLDAIEDVLLSISEREWPEPAFNNMLHLIEKAVLDAVEIHIRSHKVKVASMRWRRRELHNVAYSFMRHKGADPQSARLVVYLYFGKRSGDPAANEPQDRYAVDLVYDMGEVRATLGPQLPTDSL